MVEVELSFDRRAEVELKLTSQTRGIVNTLFTDLSDSSPYLSRVIDLLALEMH